eukprot:CAMPEP_0168424364 /NCGR_PEP_ID=MMETSP0228-20121227/34785_1 /TAXON_ID=133427 /ORGANISM="Protoceratium reticulatum, Strain CCCM 535 (=CCMP 1889)" /LENGTH=402 /DNA_ID=CAMNT_0008438353 /DNA_START=57 /DNA_END=1262 /DNA_ORIENTATION=-
MLRLVEVCLCAAVLGTSASVLRGPPASSPKDIASYSFAHFARDFQRSYARGSTEYKRREVLFNEALVQIRAVNAQNEREGRLWAAGVHPFMDWTEAERKRLNGYKPARRRSRGTALLHESARAGTLRTSANASGPVLPIRQQGGCGSCWAISAVEAVEAQLARSGESVQLSAQALVDCVPNPRHCGGSGGCDGATGELAYAFMRDHGIPLEGERPYQAATGTCSTWPTARVARVSGWTQLPSNRAEPLMRALVEQGPVVVAVDANNWFSYSNGIFDACNKDAVLDHAVLAKGYGGEPGRRAWLIQNSWGADWGESGHIRLLLRDDEEAWCGRDRKPSDGVGCDGGPSEVTVCGACGLLYDPLVPTGARLEDAGAAAAPGAPGSDGPAAAGSDDKAEERMDSI